MSPFASPAAAPAPAAGSESAVTQSAEQTVDRAAVYYHSGYWNDFPAVAAEINRRITGDPTRGYVDYFHERVGRRRFARALFLNCGNGWVEREFLQAGIIDSAVGIDISNDLLAQARAAAVHLPLQYVQADINHSALPDEQYDLVVNFAAAHHITHIDGVFRKLARGLTVGGYFVNYDYVGPHRNQYPFEQWEAAWKLNRSLDPRARQKMAYPHLATMLSTDPSEAVHSELVLTTYRRYFSVDAFRGTGGALAYPLLTFNENIKSLAKEDADRAIEQIMRADEEYLGDHPASTLFAFWYGQLKEGVLSDKTLLFRWEEDERERESRAECNGGEYYSKSLLPALIYGEA